MRKREFINIILCIVVFQSYAQSKKFIYSNSDIPQSLLLNPGAEVTYKKHIGIPLLSGLYVNAGSNNLTVTDLFSNDGIDINDKIRNQLFKMNSTDFVTANQQVEIINIGYKLKNDTNYLNFGFYQEFDFIAYFPKDLAVLFYQGNTDLNGNVILNNSTNISDLNYKGQAFGVFHAGISREVNSKLNVGVRAKLYSGLFNVQSVRNGGTLKTVLGENNVYEHQLNNFNFLFQSSDIYDNDGNFDLTPQNSLSNLFSFGNLGLGFDAGFTYNFNNRYKISASALDIGFIRYSKNVSSLKMKGDYIFDGIGLLLPDNEPESYWEDLKLDFYEQVDRETFTKAYISFLTAKVNANLQYGFGKQIRKLSTIIDCHENNGFSVYNYQNEIGVQFYSIFRPRVPQIAATFYYSRRVANILQAKITYTVDSYSFSNVGLGINTRINKFNFYAAADNLLGYADLYNSKKMSLSLGMNLIFD